MLARRSRETASQKTEPAVFAAKATDLQALRDALVDAGGVSAGLWLSYLFVLFYFAIAAGAVTHRDLLLENPVALPFLNVELPLKAFFILGPLVFLIVHAYVLLHFELLAGKIGAFHKELQNQISGDERRAQLRRQLPSNIFVQSLAGPQDVRNGITGFLLRLVIWISLVAGPIVLLLLFQLQFLPYHSEGITNWQRVALVIDLVVLWLLWPQIARGDSSRVGLINFKQPRTLAWLLVSTVPVLLAVTIATFPGESLEENLRPLRLVPTTWQAWTAPNFEAIQKSSSGWATLHELLIAGDVNFVTDTPKSLWSNVLVLPDLKAGDRVRFDAEGKLAIGSDTLSLRGRDLRGAVFARAHLDKADFTGAQLQHATLRQAELRDTKFECDQDGQKQICAQLQAAVLDSAQLHGASLVKAQLQHASLVGSKLQSVDMERAHLEGASLKLSQLQGSALPKAQLQGADLFAARMEGAGLSGANLQGADLSGAHMEGADLSEANLQGADLSGAHMEGADLSSAELQGAILARAELQGANLTGALLRAADVHQAMVWRAQPPGEDVVGELLGNPETGTRDLWGWLGLYAMSNGLGCRVPTEICDWTDTSFKALKLRVETEVPAGDHRIAALARIEVLERPRNDADQTTTAAWTPLANSQLSESQYLQALVTTLQQSFCVDGGSPEAIAGLIQRFNMHFPGDEDGFLSSAKLATDFLDEAECPPARGLSEGSKAALRQFRDRAKTPPWR